MGSEMCYPGSGGAPSGGSRMEYGRGSVGRNGSPQPSPPEVDKILYKKAQLSLTNPRDAKACQNCSNSMCLQRCRWQYWPIFICLTVIASEICEIPRNSENSNLLSSRSSKVIDLGVDRKPMYDFLLVTYSNFSRICYRFPDINA